MTAHQNRFSEPAPSTRGVTKKNATSAITPDTAVPRYSAFMILPPSLAFTKNVPTIEATIDTAPSTSGNST
jgi:hypothetical protein